MSPPGIPTKPLNQSESIECSDMTDRRAFSSHMEDAQAMKLIGTQYQAEGV